MHGKVYVVHCVDTEGPLYEDVTVLFQQLKDIYGIELEPTKSSIDKLLCEKGYENEEAIKNLIDPHKRAIYGTWEEIGEMLQIVTSHEFRNQLMDANGNGWKYSWFCMDHVGFTGENPRRRDEGHHKVFDYYQNMVNNPQNIGGGDIVQFHHHPVPISGNYHESGTAYWGRTTLDDILCHKILDRKWFPTVYRPGYHVERPDSNFFLEQWIPFDYGNQAVHRAETNQLDLMDGILGNWDGAPSEWRVYHPSHDDYRAEGTCRRWIARCLNMYARIREIEMEDIREAFERAQKGEDTILSFTNHDFKDMVFDVNRVRDMIAQVQTEFPDVSFEYADALEAIQNVCNLPKQKVNLSVELDLEHQKIHVYADDVFGPQPYLALQTKDDRYIWDNFTFCESGHWSYTFYANTIVLSDLIKIGVAANSSSGDMEVVVLEV
ncbi:MAG: hypothetical protein R3Y54_09555 [Eubacteriales bacterium]